MLAATVGARVQRYRKLRNLTAQQVSDLLMSSLGVDMKRTVLGGLESGARKAVALSEVLALAYVLGVPPLLLMTPLGGREEVEAVPGHDADPWDVARWITGEGPPPDGGADPAWRRNVDLLALYRDHSSKEDDWSRQARVDPTSRDGGPARVDWDRIERRRAEIEDALRLIRRAIRGRGDLPPALPPELAHLDDGEPEPRLRPTIQPTVNVIDDEAVEQAIEQRRARRSATKEGGADE